MSLIGSVLGLLLVPMKMKPPTKREAELVDEVSQANFALNHWRNAWHVLWAENERLIEQNRSLGAERNRLRRELMRETDFNLAYEQVDRNAQAQQHQAQAMANYQGGLAQALGMQNQQSAFAQYAQAYQRLCNCVPSRGEVIGVHVAEPLPR